MGKVFYKSSNLSSLSGTIIKDFRSITVTPEALAMGYTAHDSNGKLIIGTNEEFLAAMKNEFIRKNKNWDDPYYDEDGFFTFKNDFNMCECSKANFSNLYVLDSNFFANTTFGELCFPNLSKINGTYTFSPCSLLTSVSMPKLEAVPSFTFYGCNNLKTIYVTSARYLYNCCFAACNNLTDIYLPRNGITKVQGDATTIFTIINPNLRIHLGHEGNIAAYRNNSAWSILSSYFTI